MILQALYDLYSRYPDGALPIEGYEEVPIAFKLVVDANGNFVDLVDVRDIKGNKRMPKRMRLPSKVDRPGQGSWQTAFLLWDHPRYVLGIPPDDSAKEAALAPKRVEAFVSRIEQSFPTSGIDPGVDAVLNFYSGGGPEHARQHPLLPDLLDSKGNVAFQLLGDVELVAQRPEVVRQVRKDFGAANDQVLSPCLVTGEPSAALRLHPATPLPDRRSKANAKLHSMHAKSSWSYGKAQGLNAPVSGRAAFRYATALNHLLRDGSEQKARIADSWAVFWAERPHDLETALPNLFGEPQIDDPEDGKREVQQIYKAVESGKFAVGGRDDRVHVLGLSPSDARISIRFWQTAPAIELARRVRQHFEDLRIHRRPGEFEHLSLFQILEACAPRGDKGKLPPNLDGQIAHAILSDLPYPISLLNAAIQCCRTAARKRPRDEKVTYPRAAAIKAWLCREYRRTGKPISPNDREPQPMLDPQNANPAYRLGRLFAVLERIQEQSSRGINATIRDRFYGAASGTPGTVFPTLLRLKNHHVAKLGKGRAVQMERLVGEIMEGLDEFPPHMLMSDQGRFAIGYYHQRQALFAKRSEEPEGETNGTDATETKQ
ncbi:type I-C CRISPR-associated protein Cas8c/Csd1 [Halochromatium glycolicum]|uniref:Type I-C CRISPR-associated protein Cas8c/Csd1 n=1 Tax=Halochromatium glycolicum TaxID=85075 RepID=A0AAJ0X7H7_9GAMM|nr:type I-C CRISPR-associated protein Cas8c/Csd1 [Halochromatium glycolicum]MBK1703056.1 type I-C CRISPR-associated protein Cas8c/Csd1 [Halochromatium glycolicum]